MRALRFAPWLLFVVPITAAFGCYGATETTIVITTDLACNNVDTLVFKGAPNAVATSPDAETKACTVSTQAGGDANIGTLTFVPGGAKDARVEVKVVLAQNGRNPATCSTSDATDCIVATRTFSFVEHSSQNVPIRLLKECIGTVCPEGQTCVSAGVCTSNKVECASGSCGDAGSDGSVVVDGGHGDGTCESRGTAHDGVLATTAMPKPHLSALLRAKGVLYWSDSATVSHVSVTGTGFGTATPGGTVMALADGASDVVGETETATLAALFRGADTNRFGTTGLTALGAAPDFAILGYANGTLKMPYGATSSTGKFESDHGATNIAIGRSTVYLAYSAGVDSWNFDGNKLPPTAALTPMKGNPVVVATWTDEDPAQDRAVAAGMSSTVSIVNLVNGDRAPYDTGRSAAVRSIAVDRSFVYVAQSTGIDYVPLTFEGKPVSLYDSGRQVEDVFVDDQCVYFWEPIGVGNTGVSSSAVLRAVTKPKP